jgi:putative hydrolase of the HAD superfamily
VGRADLKEELGKKLDEWKWAGTVDELLDLWFADDANQLNEEFFPVIEDLRARGIGVYLATNNEKYRTRYLTEKRGLGRWFDAVFSSGLIGSKKPEKEFYDHVFANIKEPKENALYWDDDKEHISIAKSLGINAHLYTTFDDFLRTVRT